MGGGGGFVGGLVSGVVGSVMNAVGLGPKTQTVVVEKQANSGEASATGADGATTEGPTQGGPKRAYGGTYASQRNQGAAGAAGGGGSTMLTGPTGVQEKDIALGKRTLLGE
jgi:hypothetical protein